ncbi:MAG: sigma-70 family RNA polymerase sigma factor [Firmicutes bacterium]|nr:sigma-70 family RNA polymerase sigma factor [Bacillota bacterium]
MGKYEKKSDIDLAALAAGGNADATDVLLARYKDAVRATAKKYFMLGGDQDDIIQEGMIGLFKAVQTFDPEGGASFKTYMNICVHNQILNAIEAASTLRHSPLNSSVSLDNPAGGIDGEPSALGQMISVDMESNPAEQAIFAEAMQLILSEESKLLSPMEKQVARSLADGRGYKEIAAELGRSPKSVDNTIQRIRRKLKDFFD